MRGGSERGKAGPRVMSLVAERSGPWLVDGALGTSLHGRGLPLGAPPEGWRLARIGDVVAVLREHVRAGAHAVLTCTFNAHPPLLRPCGLHSFTAEIRRLAVEAARRSGAERVLGVV